MISGSSSTIRPRLDTLAVYLTNSRAKHSLVTSRSSRAPPSRRRESAKIGATVEPQGRPRSHEEEPSMTTVGATAPAPLEELLRTRVARFVECVPDWDAFADARVEVPAGPATPHPRPRLRGDRRPRHPRPALPPPPQVRAPG